MPSFSKEKELMKIFVIDDDLNFFTQLVEHFSATGKVEYEGVSISEDSTTLLLAEYLKDSVTDNGILLINVNLPINKAFRQQYKGIELLTWLRVKEVMNHCILYSFQSAEAIARADEKNRLLFSEGTTFIQLPNNFSLFAPENFEKLAKLENASLTNLKTKIKPFFDIGEFRHREANWWGLKQLWDVHKIADLTFDKEYPKFIEDNQKKLNNAIGVFLNELEYVDVISYTGKISKQQTEIKEQIESKEQIENSLSATKNELKICEDKLKESNENLNKLLSDLLHKALTTGARYEPDAGTVNEKSTNENLENKRRELRNIILDLQNELKKDNSEISVDAINKKVRESLFEGLKIENIEGGKKILLIDDNAKNGWEDIFSEITKSEIKAIIPAKEYEAHIEILYKKEVKDEIDEFKPDLIMLDLRLFDETERSIDITELSGSKLLEFIRRDFLGIPILITTASNKIWTYQSLIKLGADAYWIKEGFDEQREAKDSAKNYCQLVRLISKLTDERYETLINFAKDVQNLNKEESCWWENVTWIDGTLTKCKTEKIFGVLNDSILVLKNYLHNYHLEYGFRDEPNVSFVLSGLINKIAGVYEFVHEIDDEEKYVKYGSDIIPIRGDLNARELKKLRNSASHTTALTQINFGTLMNSITEAIEYLQTPFNFQEINTTITSSSIINEELHLSLSDKTDYVIDKMAGITDQDCTYILENQNFTKYIISFDDEKVFVSATLRNDLRNIIRKSLRETGEKRGKRKRKRKRKK